MGTYTLNVPVSLEYLHDFSDTFLKIWKLLWGEIAFQKRFVFYRTSRISSFYRISNHKNFIEAAIGGNCCLERFWNNRFPVPRNMVASKMGNGVISLLWQLWCHCNADHSKFSSLSRTAVVLIFHNFVNGDVILCSNLGRIDPEKPYRATLKMKHALNVALQQPRDLFNRLFSSFPKPLFQSETNCEAIDMKRTSYYQEPITPVIIHE